MAEDGLQSAFADGSGVQKNAVARATPFAPAPGGSAGPRDDVFGVGERTTKVDSASSASMLESLLKAVERIESVLDLETQMLDQNRPLALHDFNHKKSHGLLELRRAMSACRSLDRSMFDFETRVPLARLRTKLDRNLVSLQTHLKAVTEIAAIITRAIQDHESDGTYTLSRCARDDR